MRPFLTLHHPAHARRYYAEGLWTDDTFYGLLAGHAAQQPKAWALRDGRNRLSWSDLKAWADGCAADLMQHGLEAGDRVSIFMSNRVETLVTFLACSRQGLACNPSLHRTHTCGEIVTLLKRLNARGFVTEPGWGVDRANHDFDAMLGEVATLKAIYAPETFPKPGVAEGKPFTDPDKVAYLAFTSGTTGAPKCVMHSDNTLLSNARDLVRDWKLDASARILTLSPLSHHIAWVAVAQWLICGGELILDDPPQGVSRLDWIAETQATYVLGVPTHAMDILSELRKRNLPRLGDVKTFYMAGAPIPPSVAEAFIAQGITPQNIYGMTESSSHQYTHPDDATGTIVSTCGRGGKAYEVRLFDPEDANKPVPAGTVGQIAGRGALLMLGYMDNQTATEQSFNRDGWFLSGDLGVMDEKGNLRVEGRLKDLIIRGGHNIYPSHIEAIALRSGKIAKAAAIPIPDERLGERVCLAIIGDLEPDALLAYLHAEGLSRYDMPEYYLRVAEFPLTASGKILKRELIEQIKRGELTPQPVRFQLKESA